MSTLLHVGCGGDPLPTWLGRVKEVRLDIDDTFNPDIVADIRDFKSSDLYDYVYSSHVIEHLYPHEVTPALANLKRVLKTGGMAITIVPNLENIKPTNDVVYVSPAGPVTGLDMYYGMRSMLSGNPYMAHHTGFVPETLKEHLLGAGFKDVKVMSDGAFNIIAIGVA